LGGLSASTNGVAVDDAHVYWNLLGQIGRANLDGTGVDRSFITGIDAGAVAVDAAHVYWSDSITGAIGRANLDGSGVEPSFIPNPGSSPCGVAVDDAHVYWNLFFGRIGRANLDGTGVDRSFIRHGRGFGRNSCGVAVDALRSFGFVCPGLPKRTCDTVKTNQAKGAKLTVKVPRPGDLRLAQTTEVKGAKKRAGAKGKAKLPLRPRGKKKKQLTERGTVSVVAEVTYTPRGGDPNVVASTLQERLRLVTRG
jgi:hypothetical protein